MMRISCDSLRNDKQERRNKKVRDENAKNKSEAISKPINQSGVNLKQY
ncbi:hypothetical protein [Pseudoalteromonas sp. SS15]